MARLLIIAAMGVAILAWLVAMVSAVRAYLAVRRTGTRAEARKALVAWPFFAKHLQGPAAAEAKRANIALAAFFFAMIVIAATSTSMVGEPPLDGPPVAAE